MGKGSQVMAEAAVWKELKQQICVIKLPYYKAVSSSTTLLACTPEWD